MSPAGTGVSEVVSVKAPPGLAFVKVSAKMKTVLATVSPLAQDTVFGSVVMPLSSESRQTRGLASQFAAGQATKEMEGSNWASAERIEALRRRPPGTEMA